MKGKDSEAEAGILRKIAVSIGDYSYGIFYIHMAVLLVVQKAVSKLWVSQVWILGFVSCFVLTAVGSYVVVWVARKIAEILPILSVVEGQMQEQFEKAPTPPAGDSRFALQQQPPAASEVGGYARPSAGSPPNAPAPA